MGRLKFSNKSCPVNLRSPLVNLRGFCGELHHSIDAIMPMLVRILPQLPDGEREVLTKELCQHMPRALTYIITAAEKMDRAAIRTLLRQHARNTNQRLTDVARYIIDSPTADFPARWRASPR